MTPDAARILGEQFTIQRLNKAGIDDGCGKSLPAKLGSELLGQRQQGSQTENCHLVPIADDLCLADRQRDRLLLDRGSWSCTSRITHRGRPRLQHGRVHHVRQLILVFGNHVDDVGNAAQIADVEQPVVRGTIISGEPASIHAEDNRQVLQANVMHDRVKGALQEGRVDGAEGAEARSRHASGKDDRVLFGDAYVEVAVADDADGRGRAQSRWAWRQ